MFTNNYWKILRSIATKCKLGTVYKFDGTPQSTELAVGNKSEGISFMPSFSAIKSYTGVSGSGVVFGNGTTPPSLEDYSLSGDVISTFNYTNQSSISEGNHTETYTVTNTSDTEITISEIGLMQQNFRLSDNSFLSPYCLLDRTLLETPITIPAGGVGQITYTLSASIPSAAGILK